MAAALSERSIMFGIRDYASVIDGHTYGQCLCLCLRFYFGGCGQQKMSFVSIIIRILRPRPIAKDNPKSIYGTCHYVIDFPTSLSCAHGWEEITLSYPH